MNAPWQGGAYSRVYWSILDDDKFETVYDDDHHLATWLRLLIAADMAWPASATLPAAARRASVKVLVSVGLVDLQTGSRYRIHGLDRERSGRSEAGRMAAEKRWSKDRPAKGSAEASHPLRNADPLQAETSRDETSRDENETSRDETSGSTPLPPDALDAWFRLTGSWPSSKVMPWLTDLAKAHGDAAVEKALAEESMADAERKTLLSRTQARLERAEHEASKRREAAREKAAVREREVIETMPEEQRAANLERLRQQMEAAGLVPSKRS